MDEPSPSPQKIGELFVMQYYTQMHKDPTQMHRFYMDNSVFVRGGSEMGSEESVIGQKNIHEKILSLDLQSVHTKVRQMDSHATIATPMGPGVVIQVTGELSISGNPMRPFVQTFVLAPESPRNYYVHNDIFRYQLYDEDFMSESEAIDHVSQEPDVIQSELSVKEVQSPTIPEETFYRGSEANLPSGVSDRSGKSTPTQSDSVGQPEAPPITTGADWNEQYEDNEVVQSNGLPEQAHMGGDESTYPEEEEVGGGEDSMGDAADQSKQSGTWASRIAQNIPTSTRQQPPSYTQASKSSGLTSSSSQTRTTSNVSTSQEPKPQRKPQERRPDRQVVEKKPYPQPATTRNYSDLVQIFVGGLVPGTTEEDIREVFRDYGNVIEVRFNPKNFGFVVFEDEESVQTILAARKDTTFTLKGRTLNIEEKRPSKNFTGSGGAIGRKPFVPSQQGGGGGFSNNRQAPRPMTRPPQRRN